MDILKMIAELRAEREHLEEAILVLERLAMHGGKRRGRPPKWMALTSTNGPSDSQSTGKRTFSSATRKKMAAAQRRRWAARRAQAAA